MRRRSWLFTRFACSASDSSAACPPTPSRNRVRAPPAKQLHVLANQSILLDTPFDIKRVSIARPETADVMVVSPRQMVVIGKTAGTTTLVYWSREEVANTVEVVVGINLDLVREDLQKIAPGQTFEVTAAGRNADPHRDGGGQRGPDPAVEGARAHVKSVVNLLKVQKLEQVLLQIRVSEVDRSMAKELGFNFLFEGNTLRGSVNPPNNFNPFFGN